MKKFAVLLAVIVFGATAVAPVFAYDGVSGAVYDEYTQPWQHGGTVYAIGTSGGAPNTLLGTANLSTAAGTYGQFSLTWSNTPDDNTNVTIIIVFSNGGNGTPQTQQYSGQFTQFSFIPGNYNMGNIDTETGPTAITLGGITTSSRPSLPLGAGLAVFLLVGVSFAAIRRRNVA